VSIQAQIISLLKNICKKRGAAVMLITHDMGVIAETCDRVAVMYAGRIVEEAPIGQLFSAAAHPYTQGLLGALPPMDGPRRRLAAIPGGVPEPWAMPPGCAFAPRCAHRVAACDTAAPGLIPLAASHRVACLQVAQVAMPRESVPA
jgi:peptide/nickel transport system ATP-binding protein